MRRSATALCAAIISASLAACNSTDALTPQVDVGGGLGYSSPVTQAEVDRMVGNDSPVSFSSLRVAEQPRHLRPPQNTLEAQAQALEAGNTSASRTEPPAPGSSRRTSAPAASAPNIQTESQTASRPSTGTGTIRFLPIIGAPVQAVTPLSRQLGTQARAAGLVIRASGDVTADHILKGYFSAFDNGSSVTVVYVWDILDNGGNRMHRLQGQVQVSATAKDPWAAVPPSTMENVATKTINEYVAWKQAQGG